MSFRAAGRGRQIAVAISGISLCGAMSALIDHNRSNNGLALTQSSRSIAIVRVPAAAGIKHAGLSPQANRLFTKTGKQNRADYDDGYTSSAAGAGTPQLVAASMTSVDIGGTLGAEPDTVIGQDVNRHVKMDRLSLQQKTVAKLIAPMAEPSVGGAGVSAALFFVAPSPIVPEAQAVSAPPTLPATGPANAEDTSVVAAAPRTPEASAQASWADLVKLARLKGGDGEEKEPGIFGGLTEKEFRAREIRCMATAVYFEARGETVKGQTAVAQVIMTRVRSDYYPNTICGVVYQGQWNKNSCQFSFACDGLPDTPKNREQWEAALQVVKNVISGKVYLEDVADATHYHASYVSPDWRKMVKKLTKIGVHIFYKAPFVNPLVASNDYKL